MGFQDRHYNQEQVGYGASRRMAGGFGLPSPTPIVKYLLIINIAVYVLQMFKGEELNSWFAASGSSTGEALQVWRLVTFQFLHGGGWHLFGNLLGIFFLGPALERHWGSKTFLKFYLTCGAVGGLLYVLVSRIFGLFAGDLIGASGGVLGLLVACAILFPHFVIILLFFPVPIRFAAVLATGVYGLSVLQGIAGGGGITNAGGDLCHLGGMATGFLWVMGGPYMAQRQRRRGEGAYQRKIEAEGRQQYEVDRILAKVHHKGIHSLSRKERQILQQATDAQKRSSG